MVKNTSLLIMVIESQVSKLRSGTNRIYLDASKKRYLLVIGTTQTSIEVFQRNAKARQQATASAAAPSASASSNDTSANKAEKDVSKPVEEESVWQYYNLYFTLLEDEQAQSFIFKAMLRNASSNDAYSLMSEYLMKKYGDKCVIPDFSSEVIWSESIKKGMD